MRSTLHPLTMVENGPMDLVPTRWTSGPPLAIHMLCHTPLPLSPLTQILPTFLKAFQFPISKYVPETSCLHCCCSSAEVYLLQNSVRFEMQYKYLTFIAKTHSFEEMFPCSYSQLRSRDGKLLIRQYTRIPMDSLCH